MKIFYSNFPNGRAIINIPDGYSWELYQKPFYFIGGGNLYLRCGSGSICVLDYNFDPRDFISQYKLKEEYVFQMYSEILGLSDILLKNCSGCRFIDLCELEDEIFIKKYKPLWIEKRLIAKEDF